MLLNHIILIFNDYVLITMIYSSKKLRDENWTSEILMVSKRGFGSQPSLPMWFF